MPLLKQNHIDTGQVQFIYRPLFAIEDTAHRLAAEALYCAGEQGRFWEMLNWQYENVDRIAQVEITQALTGMAAPELGLDAGALGACLGEERYRVRVEQLVEDAFRRNVTGTPTFLVGDITVEGPRPYETFAQIIDQQLQSLREETPK